MTKFGVQIWKPLLEQGATVFDSPPRGTSTMQTSTSSASAEDIDVRMGNQSGFIDLQNEVISNKKEENVEESEVN